MIETKIEVIRLNKLTDRPLFQRGTSHQSKVCGGQIQHLIGFSVNGKYIFFEKNRSFPQKIITFNTIKHGGFDTFSSFFKDLFLKSKVPICPQARGLKKYLPAWRILATDQSVLHSVNEVNVSAKTLTMEQGSKENDRHGSKGEAGERNYFESFSSEMSF